MTTGNNNIEVIDLLSSDDDENDQEKHTTPALPLHTSARSEQAQKDTTTPYLSRISYIQIQDKRYYSDRFYLNDIHANAKSKSESTTSSVFLDKVDFIQNLDLVACLCSTYCMDASWMSSHLPQLFPPQNKSTSKQLKRVPTLVLHGHKGFDGKVSRHNSCSSGDKKRSSSSKRQKILRDVNSNSNQNPNFGAMHESDSDEDEDGDRNAGAASILGNSVHLTEVKSKYVPRTNYEKKHAAATNNDKIVSILDDDDDDDDDDNQVDDNSIGVSNDILNRRKSKMGVFHPKFFLLFERSGSLVVLVTTSNLTAPISVDGSWCQRFERKSLSSCSNSRRIKNRSRCDGSDFGWVLADFLRACGDAASENALLPHQFLKQYLGFSSLDDFRTRYHFERASVHLIATVPGNHGGRHTVTHCGSDGDCAADAPVERRTFLYGPQRIADICARQARSTRPWLSNGSLSRHDRLKLQTTSLGANWTRNSLSDVIRSYMGEDDGDGDCGDDVFERTDILWPSRKFMESCSGINAFSPIQWWKKEQDIENGLEADRDEICHGHFAFLSSQTFNSIDPDVISRMVQYKTSNPPQIGYYSPHIKTFCRVSAQGLTPRGSDDDNLPSQLLDFPWLMLTSACLSHGAQGQIIQDRAPDSDEMSYGNFELGVLFCSRVQGVKETDRIYAWNPAGDDSAANRIHLPIPYDLTKSVLYERYPEEERDFVCDPFFSILRRCDRSIGNMRITPAGKKWAKFQESIL